MEGNNDGGTGRSTVAQATMKLALSKTQRVESITSTCRLVSMESSRTILLRDSTRLPG